MLIANRLGLKTMVAAEGSDAPQSSPLHSVAFPSNHAVHCAPFHSITLCSALASFKNQWHIDCVPFGMGNASGHQGSVGSGLCEAPRCWMACFQHVCAAPGFLVRDVWNERLARLPIGGLRQGAPGIGVFSTCSETVGGRGYKDEIPKHLCPQFFFKKKGN